MESQQWKPKDETGPTERSEAVPSRLSALQETHLHTHTPTHTVILFLLVFLTESPCDKLTGKNSWEIVTV